MTVETAGKLPPQEQFYQWKEFATVAGDAQPRLLTPWADPQEFEFPMDWIFATVDQALNAKREHAPEEDWVLVRVTYKPVRVVLGEFDEEAA